MGAITAYMIFEWIVKIVSIIVFMFIGCVIARGIRILYKNITMKRLEKIKNDNSKKQKKEKAR